MTAIAIVSDTARNEFVIAADGRCATYIGSSVQIQSDKAQKIFPFESKKIKIAYALTGISSIASFQLLPEITHQINTVSNRAGHSFNNGYEYADKIFSNIVRMLENARKDGRIVGIPECDFIPTTEGTKKFSVFIFGYFQRKKFFSQGNFHFDGSPERFRLESFHNPAIQNLVWHTGPPKIGKMVFDPATPIDPRLSRFKNDLKSPPDALTQATNFVKACSEPFSVEIEPLCQTVGGHIHAARVNEKGFSWLINPVRESSIFSN